MLVCGIFTTVYNLEAMVERLKGAFRRLIKPASFPNVLWYFAFICAFSLFSFYQINITVKPLLLRPLPVEVDDAYTYILKAEEIRASCFLQDCRALTDLRPQLLASTFDNQIAGERLRVYQDVFLVHHPAHSLILVMLKTIGLTYEQAYDAVSLMGKVIICIGIAYWLTAIYGIKATTLSLLLLAPIVYHGQGLATVVPGNITLGLSLILWGLILQKNKFLPYIFVPLLFAIVFSHQLGRLFASIAVVLYWSTHDWPFSKQVKIQLSIALGLVILPFLLPVIVQRPEFKFVSSAFYSNPVVTFDEFLKQIPAAFTIVRFWAVSFPNISASVSLIIIGALTMHPKLRRGWSYMGGLLLVLLCIGIFWSVPGRQAPLFQRVWVPSSLFLTGTIGQAAVFFLALIFEQAKQLRSSHHSPCKYYFNKPWLAFLIVASTVIFLFVQIFKNYYSYYAYHYDLTLENQITRYDITLNSAQPGLVMQTISQNQREKVVYLNRIALYYYLVYGGLDYGAVYFPAFDDSPANLNQLSSDLEDVSHLVSTNPIFRLQQLPEVAIALDDDAHLDLQGLFSLSTTSFQMNIDNPGRPVELEIEWHSGERVAVTMETVPERSSGWVNFQQDMLFAQRVVIKLIGNRGITIHGIRFDENQITHWPWEEGINLILTPSVGDPLTLEISEKRILGKIPLEIDVIDDNGFTILAKVKD